jgi:hypothetical protein
LLWALRLSLKVLKCRILSFSVTKNLARNGFDAADSHSKQVYRTKTPCISFDVELKERSADNRKRTKHNQSDSSHHTPTFSLGKQGLVGLGLVRWAQNREGEWGNEGTFFRAFADA